MTVKRQIAAAIETFQVIPFPTPKILRHLLQQRTYQERLARGLVRAVVAYFAAYSVR